MKVITRGNSNPSGKAKLFFCCHPDDFDRYFDRICDDILDICNCAIYYNDDNDESVELLDLSLQQMNLFVVPVTRRLLSDYDDLVEHELNVARENNIPFLHIMMEDGIRKPFEDKFGKVQYLNGFKIDDTAIPYREKLRSFLESVIYGDELAEKIREAFDAYIFLSYRKKDRREAQKLMSLVHENEFARDIAIWYDEFLVPGENFNEYIERALKKSSLFLLTVTPNLINENNYILRIEYPMAVDYGKPIAPVEMVTTDEDELKRRCDGIPDMVSSDDKDSLARRLEELLPVLSNPISSDPKHLFFIGLAYLMGIDVEKNSARAISLIKQSAESGLDEAIEKLSDIYYYGEGVPSDFEESVKWSRKIVDKYMARTEESHKEEDLYLLLGYTIKHGERALSVMDYEEARWAFEKTELFGKLLAFQSPHENPVIRGLNSIKKLFKKSDYYTDALMYIIRSYKYLSEIYKDMGFVNDSANWARKALIFSGIHHKAIVGNQQVLYDLLSIFGTMFILCIESGNIDAAEVWYDAEKGLILEGENLESSLANIRLSMHHCMLLEKQKDFSLAIEKTMESYELCKNLYEEYRNPELLDLALSQQLNLIKLFEHSNDRDNAENCIDALLSFIKQQSAVHDYWFLDRYRCLAFLHKGDMYMDLDLVKSREYISIGIVYINEAYEMKVDSNNTEDVLYGMMKMGELCLKEDDVSGAIEWGEKLAVFITDTLYFTRSIKDIRSGAEVFELLFHAYTQIGYGMLAKKWYDYALNSREAVYASTNLQDDANALNRLRGERELFKHISRTPTGVMCLIDVLKGDKWNPAEVDETALIKEVYMIMDDFWKTHPKLNRRDNLLPLISLLKNEKKDSGEHNKSISHECGKVVQMILDSYKPFLKYEEEANIVAVFCGYAEFYYSKAETEGDNIAGKGFRDFFWDIPILYYPLEKINHIDTWKMLYKFVYYEVNAE